MNDVAIAELTFQMLIYKQKTFIPPEQVVEKVWKETSSPDSSNGYINRNGSKGWGFDSPSGRYIFFSKA